MYVCLVPFQFDYNYIDISAKISAIVWQKQLIAPISRSAANCGRSLFVPSQHWQRSYATGDFEVWPPFKYAAMPRTDIIYISLARVRLTRLILTLRL